MSKLIHIRGATGWLAAVMLGGGLFLVFASLGLIALNIYFSAVGLIEATGGEAKPVVSIWFPALVVIKGGPIGLITGLGMGLMISIVQSAFWLAPLGAKDRQEESDEDEDPDRAKVPAPIFALFMAFVMLYDICSTWFYLSSALPDDKNVLMTLTRYVITLAITLIAFSFGAEFWGALGVEIVQANYREGVEALKVIRDEFFLMLNKLRGVRSAPRVRTRSARLD